MAILCRDWPLNLQGFKSAESTRTNKQQSMPAKRRRKVGEIIFTSVWFVGNSERERIPGVWGQVLMIQNFLTIADSDQWNKLNGKDDQLNSIHRRCPIDSKPISSEVNAWIESIQSFSNVRSEVNPWIWFSSGGKTPGHLKHLKQVGWCSHLFQLKFAVIWHHRANRRQSSPSLGGFQKDALNHSTITFLNHKSWSPNNHLVEALGD